MKRKVINYSEVNPMPKTIAVISDTHDLLRPEVIDRIADCDGIVHAGDINKPEIVEQLKSIAPLYVVRGNNDKEWAEGMPETLTFQIEDCRFFMVHNKKFVSKGLHDTDVVIYGHSHKYAEQMVDGVLWPNPGSCGKRRFDQEITFAMMTVDGSKTEIAQKSNSERLGSSLNIWHPAVRLTGGCRRRFAYLFMISIIILAPRRKLF